MFLSVFELFKIGIGPSSSHTMGPMVAAAKFLHEIKHGDWPRREGDVPARISVTLHGSLAFTGKGHATDNAVILGLAGHDPSTIDTNKVDEIVQTVSSQRMVTPDGHPAYAFDPREDLIFDYENMLPLHTNGMTFRAFTKADELLLKREYYSIGGGFVVDEAEYKALDNSAAAHPVSVPYPFENADQMLKMAKTSGLSIADMKRENEKVTQSVDALSEGVAAIWETMDGCVKHGLEKRGVLPGGLDVKRRSAEIHDQLQSEWGINRNNPIAANEWLQVFAMAVNEENAAGGKVVTAPTNGAAGVIPAVLSYRMKFFPETKPKDIEDFLLTASAIGGILKHNASISGAEVGCQGEVGSASAMAAAGLAAIMGGTPEQIENAAEIALEHHLGMTCDPIGGLVQVPCIERNGLGAIKAVSAASLALRGDGTHFVSLDACVKTMLETGKDMHARYKETSQGGLAVNVVEC
ncbi:MAG: L-serine ammonia-lyase [Rhizobiaceae bacterium]|nr:L-serine ammonia-lyase [Rhizobiaceae bacterium]